MADRPCDKPAGFVVKVEGRGYFVKSRSTEGAWWHVVGSDCSCPATTRNCWHVRRTYEYEKRMGPPPRPIAPPNVSALVD